jgi:iron(III) transport system ATP-binding protein
MPEIAVRDLHKRFGTEAALDGVSFDVQEGEFLTLLGPSGCGKTTTLMSIAGFQKPDTGTITVGGRTFVDCSVGVQLPAEERNLGLVFQSYAIWPHMTVARNVGFPLRVGRVPRPEAAARVAETLELVEMQEYSARYPHELSGGQQQRVALARALVHRPSVLLLDEPFSNLDAKLRERARVWLKRLQGELGITTVFVTHDQDEALSMSDRILVMNRGRILQAGSPEQVYERPTTRFVAEFLGRCNVFGAEVVSAGAQTQVKVPEHGLRLTSADRAGQAGQQVELAVRPESVRLRPLDPAAGPLGGNEFPATVLSRSFLGDRYIYELDVRGLGLVASATRGMADTQVAVLIPPDACRVLAPEAAAQPAPRPDPDDTDAVSVQEPPGQPALPLRH